jgi:diguanylate cyclase (GGDEF)-like protein/PAS domain S-box-containing protein
MGRISPRPRAARRKVRGKRVKTPRRPASKGSSRPKSASRRLSTVSVPEPIRPLFLKAQDYVSRYFATKTENPAQGTISISGERYILLRAASMSIEFFDLVTSLYKDKGPDEARTVASNLLFDLAHAIGKADAQTFHSRMGVEDPIEKLSAGPIHFSFAGWAFVKISPESNPTPDENYFLIYDHPFSFESDAWLRKGRKSEFPVCIMNAGYSSGWCEESFGVPLVAAEIECLARGDAQCRFVMAPPARIEQHLAARSGQESAPARGVRPRGATISAPEFFQRKRMEEELRQSHETLEAKVEARTAALLAANDRLHAEIAERTRAERALRESEGRYRTLVEHAPDALVVMDVDKEAFVDANENAARLFGIPRERLLRMAPADASPPTQPDGRPSPEAAAEQIEKALAGETPVFEWTYRSAARENVACEVRLVRLPGAGRLVFGSITDITERKQSEERVRHMAHHDALTGLPNRTLFQDRVSQAIAQAHRTGSQVATLFVDLDRFKDINDSLGHDTGDRLLRLAGGRLQACLREGDTVARLGGDEFVVGLPAVADSNDAMLVAGKILEALREPFAVDGHELHVSGSVGISLYPADGDDTETLMRAADTAMYHAKERGRDNYQFFMPALNEAAQRRLIVATRLHQALPQGEFVLHYQPLVRLDSRRFFAAEALVRWRQADGSLLLPGEFIKIAEETGIIVPLGEWALKEAVAELARWRKAGHPDLCVAVNLSPRQLRRSGFPDLVAGVLREAGLSAEALQLEITEGMLMLPSPEALAMLEELARMGVRLAVDDFGTRYSSLAYLQRFPIHALKIDQSFVGGIGRDANDTALVTAMIAMAQSLRLMVIAEGVETAEQAAFLKAKGCEAAQGFFYGKALPADALSQVLLANLR